MGLATHIVVSKVHFWVIWDSYWLILWCQKTHIDSYCGVKSPFLSDLRLILWCQKSISEWFENPVNLGLKKELGLTPPAPYGQCPLFLPFFFYESVPYKHLAFRNQAQEVHIKIPFLATRSSILLYHSTTMFRSELGLGFRPEYQRICDENTLQCQQSLETQRSDSFFTA